jgi:hypothetical protein
MAVIFNQYSYDGLSEENEKEFAIRLTKDYGVATYTCICFL